MQMSGELSEFLHSPSVGRRGRPHAHGVYVIYVERNRIGIAESRLSLVRRHFPATFTDYVHPQPIKLDVAQRVCASVCVCNSPLTHFALHAKRYKSFVVVGFHVELPIKKHLYRARGGWQINCKIKYRKSKNQMDIEK